MRTRIKATIIKRREVKADPRSRMIDQVAETIAMGVIKHVSDVVRKLPDEGVPKKGKYLIREIIEILKQSL